MSEIDLCRECIAEELCRQYMGRAKEALSIPKQRMNETELVIADLTSAQTDISMAMFQLGRMFESGDKNEVEKSKA